ncbi:MAG TPA: DoxX family protein [Pyrinomonadaceae bacterium]|nr:DoxX family protein [Pyrinomonadaceae bacterium]
MARAGVERFNDFFRRRAEYGPVFIRLVVGWMLIWGTLDNILSWERMTEFERFLAARGVPLSMFAAHLSVYTQFVCGVLVLLGAFVRLAAVPLVINFVCALLIAHRRDTWAGAFPALVMLASALFFLFHGAGRLSVDERR